METTILVIIGLVLLIIIHELGHFSSAKWLKVKVDEFGIGFPPKVWAKKVGETIYSLNLIPFGGFVRIFGEMPGEEIADEDKKRSFTAQAIWKRAIIISAGVVANIITAWLVFSVIFMIGTASVIFVNSVDENSPASEAGLLSGDTIIGFDTSDQFISFLDTNKETPVELKILREEQELTLIATPRPNSNTGKGELGISILEGGIPKQSFFQSFIASAKFTFSTLLALLMMFGIIIRDLLTGSVPDVVGPVGIFSFASQVGQSGIIYLAHLIGMISLNLAILNILPFPALDGGRLLFLFAEKIKGSPLPQKFEIWANALGFLILVFLMVLVTIRDVGNLL